MYLDHARRELELCGQLESDPEFGMSLLAAIAGFSTYPGHSGGSHYAAVEMLTDLLNMRNLSPLTNNPDEWFKHTPDTWDGVNHVWQNKRNSEAFSTDGGLTYTLLSEPKSDLDANGGELPLHRTMITHTMEGQPIKPVVEETEDWVGVAEPAVNGSNDGEQDAVVGLQCTCGEIHRAVEFDGLGEGHAEVRN